MRNGTWWNAPVDRLSFDFAIVLDKLDIFLRQFFVEAQESPGVPSVLLDVRDALKAVPERILVTKVNTVERP